VTLIFDLVNPKSLPHQGSHQIRYNRFDLSRAERETAPAGTVYRRFTPPACITTKHAILWVWN